jgi:Cu+-exporting ATPase
MINIKYGFYFSIFVLVALISCNKNTGENVSVRNENVEVIAENIKNIEVEIEGMTCEIGCARLIQSRLSKTDGIKFVQVSFENKLGDISYDENIISKKEIMEEIEKVAGGDTYKVVAIKEVASFSMQKIDTVRILN